MYASAANSVLSALLVGAGLTTGLLLYVPFLFGWRGKPAAPSRLPTADVDGTPMMLPSSPERGTGDAEDTTRELPPFLLAEPLPPLEANR